MGTITKRQKIDGRLLTQHKYASNDQIKPHSTKQELLQKSHWPKNGLNALKQRF